VIWIKKAPGSKAHVVDLLSPSFFEIDPNWPETLALKRSLPSLEQNLPFLIATGLALKRKMKLDFPNETRLRKKEPEATKDWLRNSTRSK
jgi:hypothetical protein